MNNVSIKLNDKVARRLTKLAKEKGKTLEEYLQEVATTQAKTEANGKDIKMSVNERIRAFDKWIDSFTETDGELTLDDSRESIYEGRGE